ncbi:hypothetical protein C7S18_12530 [Ahniella affigens]|uniref:Zinc resistance-associated protein n=1 Tax=Ahniella affigens TaxID=2021234 RepID=A0A2P1PT11_9GAMM|nr:Spy/CpxP family protein refolding chaperone [Ahniella affigens]AVP97976.1 hypothetical protein C7S18_12530 [Ahniella affigens]
MKTRSLVLVGLSALALAVTGVSLAQQQSFGARWLERQEAALSRLDLDAAQRTQLDQLLADQRAFRLAAHSEIGTLIDQTQSDLRAPDADLHQIAANADRALFALLAEGRGLRNQRMAFYDSLSPEQQAEVRSMLANRLDRAKRLHAFVGDLIDQAP